LEIARIYVPASGGLLSASSITDRRVALPDGAVTLTTTGDIIYASAAHTPARLGVGSAYQTLAVNSAGTLPTYQASPASLLTTTGDVLYATAANTPARLAIGSTNQALGVTGGIPAWQASSKSVLTTTGDVMYASAANVPARLGIGSSAQVLTVTGGLPVWAAPASAGVGYPLGPEVGAHTSIPAGSAYAIALSPDGNYLAVASQATPYLEVWKMLAGVPAIKLANPGTLPAGTTAHHTSLAWSPNSTYLIIGHNTSPFVSAYSVSGTTLTYIAQPASLPASAVTGVRFSDAGTDVFLTSATTPFLYAYPWTTGWGTRYANPTGAQASWLAAPNHAGTLVCVGLQATPFVHMFPFTTGVGWGTKYSNPSPLPAQQWYGGVAWAPDDSAVVGGVLGNQKIEFCPISGGAFGTIVASIAIGSFSSVTNLAFDPDGRFVVASGNGSPYVACIGLNGNYYTPSTILMPGPLDTPALGSGECLSLVGGLLAVGFVNTPYYKLYTSTVTGLS
jgi:hypothetical protein